jgi:hypothetical protein
MPRTAGGAVGGITAAPTVECETAAASDLRTRVRPTRKRAADCLRYDEEPAPGGGKQRRPVLRYLREKPPSKWLSLPINQDAAELIEAQQQRLQERFPDTKLGKLAPLPCATATRRGGCR